MNKTARFFIILIVVSLIAMMILSIYKNIVISQRKDIIQALPKENTSKAFYGSIKIVDGSFDTNIDSKVPYLNYDEILDKNNQSFEGRYSNNTINGHIHWDKSQKYQQTPQILDSFKKISLNKKTISLPTSFKDIDENFENFDTINFTSNNKKDSTYYKDTKSGYYLRYNNFYMINCSLLSQKHTYFNALVSNIYGKSMITSLHSDIKVPFVHQYKLTIDGIGLGNTFNEMYDKLGPPYVVYNGKNSKNVWYYYYDKKSNLAYSINFIHDNMISNPSSKHLTKVKNNVITNLYIAVEEIKFEGKN